MPPAFSLAGYRNANISADLGVWARADGRGVAFDSSAGFTLPNRALRSPDASWILKSRLAALTDEQKYGFSQICPDFVIELRSDSDRLTALQRKMAEYIAHGARLGWLLDPFQHRAHIYRPQTPVENSGAPAIPFRRTRIARLHPGPNPHLGTGLLTNPHQYRLRGAAMTTAPKTDLLEYSHTMGMTVMEGRGFYYPVDTAVGRNDRLYVISRSKEETTRGIRVTMCDADSGYFGNFGGYGHEGGKFVWPAGGAVDRQGRFFISDEKLHRITAYDENGNYLFHWGRPGSADGELDTPSGLAVNRDGHIYVSDTYNHRVQQFTADGRRRQTIGAGALSLPWGLTCDADDNLYVADFGHDCVKKFAPDGEFLAAFGASGRGEGQFTRPHRWRSTPRATSM